MWLEEVLKSTKELESPKRYFLWAALCAVSAVIKDKVWVDRGGAYRLYPNIYVILHGPSGLRKGLPIALAKNLVSLVGNTRVISGRATIEGIIQELATAQSTPNGMISDSAGFIVASEFAASIVKNPMAITILTDLFDRQYHSGDWKNILKQGPEKLKAPIITLFGGANEAQFRDAINNRDILGGFLGRTFMINETSRNTVNSLAYKLTDPPNAEALSIYLRELVQVQGEFKVTDDALALYDNWYRDIVGEDVDDETGTVLRIGDHVFKVAMLFALTVHPELTITESSMRTAIRLVEPLIPSAQKTASGKGKSSLAEQTQRVIEVLMASPNRSISRERLLATNWKDFDALDLDRIMLTLVHSNVVKESQEEKGKMYYQITEEAVEQINNFRGRKRSN